MSWRFHFTNAPQHSLTAFTTNKSRTAPKTFHRPGVSINKNDKTSKKSNSRRDTTSAVSIPTGETKAGKGEWEQAQVNHELHVGNDRGGTTSQTLTQGKQFDEVVTGVAKA